MLTFDEARKGIDSKYDIVKDLGNSWLFTWEGAKDLISGDQGYVVMKETGDRMPFYAHYMKDQKYVKKVSKEYSEEAFEKACRYVMEKFPNYEKDLFEEDDYVKYQEFCLDTEDGYELITVYLEKDPGDEFFVYIESTVPLD